MFHNTSYINSRDLTVPIVKIIRNTRRFSFLWRTVNRSLCTSILLVSLKVRVLDCKLYLTLSKRVLIKRKIKQKVQEFHWTRYYLIVLCHLLLHRHVSFRVSFLYNFGLKSQTYPEISSRLGLKNKMSICFYRVSRLNWTDSKISKNLTWS